LRTISGVSRIRLISSMVLLLITKYAPVRLQDEGAFRGATCFHYYPLSIRRGPG
jgi:hypothetical protein